MSEKKTKDESVAPELKLSPGAEAMLPKPTQQTPSIGRIVHYIYGSRHFAAIITDPKFNEHEPGKWNQALTVFPPNDPAFNAISTHDDSWAGGTWHWPERVD